MADYGAQARA